MFVEMFRMAGSTVIHRAFYDKNTQILIVEFPFEKWYQYTDIPSNLVERWNRAASKGFFFNKFIKGKYPCVIIQQR